MNKRIVSARRPEKGRNKSRLRSIVVALQVMILLGMGASIGVALGLFVTLSQTLPSVGSSITAPEATIIYSSDGVVLARIFREDRTNVPLKDIPKSLRDATIAIEDSRFYKHSGIDVRGIARAIFANIRGQRLAQGGSTITQQLARNVYLSHAKTLERKVQEVVLAVMIERHFDKDRILELYLNQVYYGSGAFGVQAASKVYFGKDVNKLTLSEAALLAGLPQKPSGYSPHVDLQSALERRNVVLNRMAELNFITRSEAEAAKREKINIIPRATGRATYRAPHFVDYVSRQIKDTYGEDVLYGGGLRVYTTLNYEMQKAAEKALREGIKKHERLRKVTEGCFICIEPAIGYIRAMVGSVDPKSFFNRCTQAGRQPGSAFKVFVYTAALESGMRPYDRVSEARIRKPQSDGKVWSPRNYDGIYDHHNNGGWITLKSAVALSVNTAAIRVAEKVGIDKVIKYAQAMGITSELEPYLSTAIGGIKGVKVIEMCSAYGTFANNGVYVEPMSIVRVTNSRGEVREDFIPEGRRVISEQTCKYMDEMLRAVVTSGTGKKAGVIAEARGKTGTTNDDRDAWWIGYVPGKLVAACWVGNDDYSPMRRAYGGIVCAPIWADFMKQALPIYDRIHRNAVKVKKVKEISEPERDKVDEPSQDKPFNTEPQTEETNSDVVRVRICDESQLIAGPNCPSTHTESFIRGTEPTAVCTIHKSSNAENPSDSERAGTVKQMATYNVCSDSGLIAGPNCPNVVKRRTTIDRMPAKVCDIH